MPKTDTTKSDTAKDAPTTRNQDLPPMSATKMVEHLKAMGLARVERSKVLETYREVGQAEAIEHANDILRATKAATARTRAAARTLCGMDI